MPVRLVNVVFAAADPESLTDFWSDELEMWDEWFPQPGEGGEYRITPDEEDGGTLELVFAPASKPPKVGKNRIHLDLNTQDMWDYQRRYDDAEKYTDRRPLDIGQGELAPWVVYADAEGNEFCVLKPRDRYKKSGGLAAVVFDCADPGRLAAFWSEVTGWPIVDNQPEFAALRAPRSEEGPFIEFVRVADRSPEPSPIWLGLESYYPHQHDADIERLVGLGGRKVRRHDGEVSYTVVADPEGNEFRVVIPVWPPPAKGRV
jgi:predicted enzyme related to lactoylglutathione lyase